MVGEVTMADGTSGGQRLTAVIGSEAGGAAAGSGHVRGVPGSAGLPVAVSSLVGRERERAEVGGLVATTRLVTLTGSGGCGKTRLALEVAHDVAVGFQHGAWWVELSGVDDPGTVAQVVADAVGVREEPGRALRDTLTARLRAWHGLMVVDNCEHVVGACATLMAELLASCPHVSVLATSRESLALDGETSWEVPPLTVPDAHARTVEEVAAADAVALFETRARQVRPDFAVTDDNAAAVVRICRRLDGIPLAVELAAARVRVLSVEQIAAGLSDRFRLLTGVGRRAPARQRTLEASVAWSFGLLSDAQRVALARLSVFAGSFDLEAAQAVVVGPDIDETQVLGLVAGLADRSLLRVGEHDGRARYRLLETIRAYAFERLAEFDDSARVRDRHLAFNVGLARRAQEGLTGGTSPELWMARLSADLDDLRAAMTWAAEAGDLAGLVDITEPIVRFWFERGLSGEVRRRLLAAVEAPNADPDERVRASLTATTLAAGGGEFASAYRLATRTVDAARHTADVSGTLAPTLGLRAWMGAWSGRSTSEQVDADVEEAVQLAERGEDASTRAYVLIMASGALFVGRTIDAGRRLLEQAIEVCETNELVFQLPSVHATLGWWLASSGHLDPARRHARRGLELSRQLARPVWEAYGLIGLGAVAVLHGDHGQAQDRLSQAQAVLRSHGLAGTLPDLPLRHWLALAAYAPGDLATAQTTAAEIVRLGRAVGSRWDESNGEWLLGVLAQADDRHDDARTHLEASRSLSTDPRMPMPLGRALLGLAQLAEQEGVVDEAWELAHDGIEILDDHDDRLGAAAALETIAVLAGVLHEPERSLRLLAASERFRTESGIGRFPLEADRFGRARDAAHAVLEDTRATTCWEAGEGLSLANAVAYARRGRGERQRPKVGWAALTPTEEEVVRLVAQGHTNAEIGQRLFISVNTVKYHLTNVYAKVAVEGRTDLAVEAARRDP